MCCACILLYREEKSSHHVAMLAKFLDDNNPKTSLKSTVSNFIDLNFLWLNLKGFDLSVEENCVGFTYSINRVCENSFMLQSTMTATNSCHFPHIKPITSLPFC